MKTCLNHKLFIAVMARGCLCFTDAKETKREIKKQTKTQKK